MKKEKMITLHILETIPESRSDDYLLWEKVCESFCPDAIYKPFCEVLLSRKFLRIPNFKSIERWRRDFAKKYPELSGDKDVEAARELLEESYRAEYGRGY